MTPPTRPFEDAGADVPFAQKLLLDILDTVRDPLLVLDADFRVTQANRAFLTTFRVTREETVGEILFTLGDGEWDIRPLRDLLTHRLPLEAQLYDCDVEHVFPAIGRKIMLLNARHVTTGPEAGRLTLLAIEDVTERRFTEQCLSDQRRELERSNEALAVFASIASHDLQEPLRKILAFGELLDRTAGPALGVEGRRHLDRMLSAATRMRTLINDLLSFAQVTARIRPFVSTQLAEIAHEVVADLEAAIADAGGRVEVGELPTIEADPLQMRQLLQNLLGNALKFRRTAEPLVVYLSGSSGGGGDCVITVTDNGIGFSEAYSEKIFTMFERLHSRTAYAGNGIGLAICRKIVEHHGGTIAATSTAGQGTTVTVTLPVTQTTPGHMS